MRALLLLVVLFAPLVVSADANSVIAVAQECDALSKDPVVRGYIERHPEVAAAVGSQGSAAFAAIRESQRLKQLASAQRSAASQASLYALGASNVPQALQATSGSRLLAAETEFQAEAKLDEGERILRNLRAAYEDIRRTAYSEQGRSTGAGPRSTPATGRGTSAGGGGCSKDVDCKGDRICEAGRCVSPPPPVMLRQ